MAEQEPQETREMRLITRAIKLTRAVKENSLREYIAVRRMPGDGWMTWDEITIDLHKILDEVITDVSLKRWAGRYGIPEHSRKDGGGEVTTADYVAALDKAGIKI